MLRRLLVQTPFVLPVLAWAVMLGLLPHLADAAPLPPAAVTPGEEAAVIETRLVVAHLVALGMSSEDAQARLAALSDEERHALVQRLDEVQPGGSAAAAIAVAIIVGLLVVLILELMGRRVISRP